jgi:hypothetical protein
MDAKKKPLPKRENFIVGLRAQVIPGLRELGCHMTADDFELALRFLEDEDRKSPDRLTVN